MSYTDFLESKQSRSRSSGFDPLWLPEWLFGFQEELTDWIIRRGRAALLADCGLGKGPIQLVWAENVLRKTNRPVIIFAPLAVADQFVREGKKFGIEVYRTKQGKVHEGINVTNYQRMHYYDPKDFAGASCDESGCIKHFESKTRSSVTKFLSQVEYRLLATATPAPNDYIELGTSSEALGEMDRNQMLGMFFSHCGDQTQKWDLKGHAQTAYWRWVAGWARAIRKPSDFGYEDGDFNLPPLNTVEHTVPSGSNGSHYGFFRFANSLDEQRKEKRDTIQERCEKVAELVPGDRPAVVWCHYNSEGDLLEKLIPDAVQVAGRHSDDLKEERLTAFSNNEIRVLVTKPKIGGWGLNWQHCSDVFCFPSHSFEAYYQTIRRCWRFGQKNPVTVNLIATAAERPVLRNMIRKERQVDSMFRGIIREMSDYQTRQGVVDREGVAMEVPEWACL